MVDRRRICGRYFQFGHFWRTKGERWDLRSLYTDSLIENRPVLSR